MNSIWQSFLNLFFPLFCVVCGKTLEPDNRVFLCGQCLSQIKLLHEPVCSKCGKPGFIDICAECRKESRYYSIARAAGIYNGVLKECIHKLKYGKQIYLAKTFGGFLINIIEEFPLLAQCDLVVPVPLHRVRERERGFNQAHLLAEEIGNVMNACVSTKNLRRMRSVKPQVELPRSLRISNVRGIFDVRDAAEFRGKQVLLIDDVFTTGSTVNECSRVLIEAGAKRVSVLTAARGE